MIQTVDGFLPTPSGRFHFRWLRPDGSEQAPVLVFLHDALGSIPQWKAFPEKVVKATDLPALLIERLGHGQSDELGAPRKQDYLQVEGTDVLPRLLKKLEVEKPVLIGHSDGGTIALLFASRYPARAVVTIAAHTMVEEITLAGIRQALGQKGHLLPRLERYHGKKTQALFAAWHETWLAPAFRNWDIRNVLPDIQCPVLVMQGSEDEYGTALQVESIRDEVKGPVQVEMIEGAGHLPHLQYGEWMAGRIGNFLAEKL